LLLPPAIRGGQSIVGMPAPSHRAVRLLNDRPRVFAVAIGRLAVSTSGWRFPTPRLTVSAPTSACGDCRESLAADRAKNPSAPARRTRLRPPLDAVTFKERLLYMLQPPLENLFAARQIQLPFEPFPYQLEGIAFLMPRWSAVLADEMGLGKTMQAIVAVRLLFQAGLICNALLVCPKPLVSNWARELRQWAADLPFEIVAGDTQTRRIAWRVSNCPLKLVNYELLTRDAELIGKDVNFDLVVLDEAQRIKNREAKTARVVRGLRRQRSWALTGTPIENSPDDLINLFTFVKPGGVPADTPPARLADLTGDYILRRTKEDVLTDLPPKVVRDAYVELTPAQRASYDLAEAEGIIRLNALGDTITVQHVFELILRLKQICNFDPLTGESAKLEPLQADLAEIAASGRKAILFSQWVEPLEVLAERLAEFGPLLFHGRVPQRERPQVLEAFRNDPRKHLLLMSYGTGSVGLNLQFANYVFLFDRWWNPAVEDQAINRAHRIGQQAPVFVTRFVTPQTIEGRICEILEKKRQLFAEIIDSGSAPPSMGLSEEEIFSLFNLSVRPRR